MYLLRYRTITDYGNGPGEETREETYDTQDDLLEGLRLLQEKNAEYRHYYDTHYIGCLQWKPKVFTPYAWDIQAYGMKAMDSGPLLEQTQGTYDATYQSLEAQRLQQTQESEQQNRQLFEALKARFGE